MAVTTGLFKTPNASKYLQQLCKHFGHKVAVSYDAEKGRVDFPFGIAELHASDTTLRVTITLTDPDLTARAQGAIDSHLVSFAFRENFETMTWQ
ncbi:DUF2218 domain-containing protein [Roseobacter sp. N2S]|uniref:DUF2218 domain-containing protein n=1 Tax=Roseobacter sp. N2S TaxID=2663844 RepID=UPI00286710A0|nr:DUF2218 domain-containing protein [Roseobacter sp. N2S]MDR6266502.1 hypothetical protein [Roseobacter sp. N2S]